MEMTSRFIYRVTQKALTVVQGAIQVVVTYGVVI